MEITDKLLFAIYLSNEHPAFRLIVLIINLILIISFGYFFLFEPFTTFKIFFIIWACIVLVYFIGLLIVRGYLLKKYNTWKLNKGWIE